MWKTRRSQAGASLIGIVVALVVLCLMVILGMRIYTGQRQQLSDETAKAIEQSGIRTDSDKAVLQTAKEQVAAQEKLLQSQQKKLDEAQ